MDEKMRLVGVNEQPSPTWNYLKTNGREVVVPAVGVQLPAAQAAGLGSQASAWLVASAAECGRRVVSADDKDVCLVVDLDAKDATVSNLEVELADDACATIVAVAHAAEGVDAMLGSRLRLKLGARAHARAYVYVALPDSAGFLGDLGADLADEATLDASYYLLGAGTSVVGFDSRSEGFGAKVAIDAHYLGMREQQIDLNFVMRLAGRRSVAELDAYGVLFDNASKNLRDTIDLMHGAHGADGRENETVLIAGENVVNKSLPVILCDEDDVAGNHGATIGSISPDQIAYLGSRGLDGQSAEALFARSVLDAAIAHAPVAQARDAAQAIAERILGSDAAAEMAELVDEGRSL